MRKFHCYETQAPEGGPIVYEVHDADDQIIGIFPSYWMMMMRMLEMGQRQWLMFSGGRVAQILLQKVGDPVPDDLDAEASEDALINAYPEVIE